MIDDLKPSKVRQITSWILVVVIVAVFLPSIPFKFSGAPETQHIFGTIGKWLSGFLGTAIGGTFGAVGAYVIGSLELITSLLLLTPAFIWIRNKLESLRRKKLLIDSVYMLGAVLRRRS